MNRRNIVQYAVMALVGVAALVTLIVAIATHDEATAIPGAPKWSREAFPLRVRMETDDGVRLTDRDIDHVRSAIRYFPRGTFRFDNDPDADVVIRVHLPHLSPHSDPGAEDNIDAFVLSPDDQARAYLHHRDGLARRCTVLVKSAPRNEVLVYAHELGHCLGLAHDEDGPDTDSLMTAQPLGAFDFDGNDPRLRDADHDYIERTYLDPPER